MNAKTTASTQDFIGKEARYGARNYQPVPVVVDHARDCLVWDVEGREYIDMMGAYSAVSHGHLHPRLVAAAHRQLERVAVTSRAYHGTTLGPFLEKLCHLTGFERALPMNTGAEAVETAIKCARRWGYRVKGIADGQAEILVARGNFHGRTSTIVGFSSEADYREGFGPFAPGFVHFDFGDMASVRAATTGNTCAVIVEPIQGEAGVIVPPEGFFTELREWCSRNDILLIIDEVQAGLGRTGRWFAFEHEGIRPDGLILGKALGGGLLPVSAFLADDSVMSVFNPGSHGSTFGGNALGGGRCAGSFAGDRGREPGRPQCRAGRLPDCALAGGDAGQRRADPRGARARPVDRGRCRAGTRVGSRAGGAHGGARCAVQGDA